MSKSIILSSRGDLLSKRTKEVNIGKRKPLVMYHKSESDDRPKRWY